MQIKLNIYRGILRCIGDFLVSSDALYDCEFKNNSQGNHIFISSRISFS